MDSQEKGGVRNLFGRLFPLLRVLVVDSGKIYWTDKKIQTTSRRRLRLNLFLTSFLILFYELALIRWIPAYVRYLGYFLNFILLAVFLGIGIGILAGRHQRLWIPPFPLLWSVLAYAVAVNRFEFRIPSTQVLYYGASEGVIETERFLILPVIFILVALSTIPLARGMGRLLTSLPPLEAYGVDILGSLGGIAAFFFISYFSLQPIIWFAIVTIIFLVLRPPRELPLSTPFLVGTMVLVFWLSGDSEWSPYYRIQTRPNQYGGYLISVNNTGHQETMPLIYKENFYFRVYDLLGSERTFEKVLVLGAGTGSDVAIALHEGAREVDAVEIDPVIYRLGQTLNPDRPYDSPNVKVIVNDGRFYLNNTTERYDLIIFALPDSLTLTSGFSSLRLESFLLTTEALESARDRLTEDGVLVLYNYYREDWLIQKLAAMLETAFGEPPYVTTYGDWGKAAVMISANGSGDLGAGFEQAYSEKDVNATSERGFQLPIIGSGRFGGDPGLDPALDDWPFVYMPERAIPTIYLLALGMVLVISVLMLLVVSPRRRLFRLDWHFFFLGIAFLLLETRSLVTFSLLFGTTWMVNSLVFFAILSSVLLAILVNARFKIRRVGWLYVTLVASILVNYLIPQRFLLDIQNPITRYALASFLAFLPIFLANVVFSRSFRDTETADIAFGSNLLGAMIGGLLEYVALVTGYQALLLVALGAYLLAFLFWQRERASFLQPT